MAGFIRAMAAMPEPVIDYAAVQEAVHAALGRVTPRWVAGNGREDAALLDGDVCSVITRGRANATVRLPEAARGRSITVHNEGDEILRIDCGVDGMMFVLAVNDTVEFTRMGHGWHAEMRDNPAVGVTDAFTKSLTLLKEWLTPEQREQWEKHNSFIVIGCDTGKRYRIDPPGAYNIHQLDEVFRIEATWCFGPEVLLPPGDVLLTQKLALEHDEIATLKIANLHPSSRVRPEYARRPEIPF